MINKQKTITSNRENHKQTAWLLLSVATGFMFFVFTPLETYLTNVGEFWYPIATLLLMSFITFIVFFAFSWIAWLILRRLKAFGAFFTFCFFAFLGLYVQGNIVPRPYGVIDGREVDWNGLQYRNLTRASIIIIVSVLFLTVLSCHFLKGKIYRIAPVVCTVMMFAQISTLGVLTIINTDALKNQTHGIVITNDRLFSLSKRKNILVILLDTFGADKMQQLLQEPDSFGLTADLSGFTFYPDTVGAYSQTEGAMPFLLEGARYINEKPFHEFIQEAYAEHPPMYDALTKAGYSIGVYYDSPSCLNQQTQMYANVKQGHYTISDPFDFWKTVYKMVFFNYAPHPFKSRFTVSAHNFVLLKKLEFDDGSDYSKYNYSVVDLYSVFHENGLSFGEEANAFRFYYTDGIHSEYTFNEDLEEGMGLTDYDEAKGCMKFLREFISEIKRAGSYDHTAIVVLADHSDSWQPARGSNPLLMIKPFNSNEAFSVSDLPVSYLDLQATLSSLALETVLPGSIWSKDISERKERLFLWTQWQGGLQPKDYIPRQIEYAVRGHAGNPDTMFMTGNIYEPRHAYHDDHYYAYELGTLLYSSATANNSANRYYDYGIKMLNTYRAFSKDSSAQICFDIGEERSDLDFTMEYSNYFDDIPQTVLISVNGTSLGILESGVPVRIDRSLIGSDGILRIRFDFPNVISPKERSIRKTGEEAGTGEPRAISFTSFLLDKAK